MYCWELLYLCKLASASIMCTVVCLCRAIKDADGELRKKTSPMPVESEEKMKAEKEARQRAYNAKHRAKVKTNPELYEAQKAAQRKRNAEFLARIKADPARYEKYLAAERKKTADYRAKIRTDPVQDEAFKAAARKRTADHYQTKIKANPELYAAALLKSKEQYAKRKAAAAELSMSDKAATS